MTVPEAEMLTSGAIADVLSGGTVTEPVLQILGIRKIISETRERYRLAISDGVNFSHAMLSMKLNKMISENEVKKNGIIRLVTFMRNVVQGKSIIIISDAQLVEQEHPVRIGSPVAIPGESEKAAANQPTASAAPPVDKKPVINPYNSSSSNSNTNNPYRAQPQEHAPRAEELGGQGSSNFTPINGLNPYSSGWTIKGRVTKKLDIKEFKSGKGKLFSFNILDSSAEMKVVAFTDFVDKFFPLIEKGKLYTISKGDLKAKNAQFNKLSSSYELLLTRHSEIIEVPEEAGGEIPKVMYNFKTIESLADTEPGNVDVIAVVKSVEAVTEIVTRAGKPMLKRNINLVDQSAGIQCTLWGEQATSFPDDGQPVVIAIKEARLSDFNGRSMSVGFASEMELMPDIPEAHTLLGWFNGGGATEQVKMMSSAAGPSRDPYQGDRKPLGAIADENLGTTDGKPDYFTTKAVVHAVRKDRDLCYKACPSEGKCQKKLTEDGNKYRCESCNESYGNFKWKMLTSVNITDHTDSLWLTLFEDSIQMMLGKNADFMGDLQEQGNTDDTAAIMDGLLMREFIFVIRVKQEMYQGTPQTKAMAMKVYPLDAAKEARRLLKELTLQN